MAKNPWSKAEFPASETSRAHESWLGLRLWCEGSCRRHSGCFLVPAIGTALVEALETGICSEWDRLWEEGGQGLSTEKAWFGGLGRSMKVKWVSEHDYIILIDVYLS